MTSSEEKLEVPCLICDEFITVSKKAWDEKKRPVGICKPCFATVPRQVIQLAYWVKSWVIALYRDIAAIAQMQEEIRLRLEALEQRMEELEVSELEVETDSPMPEEPP